MIGGDITSVGGVTRYRIARLYANGALDTSFQNGLSGASGTVNCLAVQSDGRIVMGGTFTTVNGTSRYGVARLNANGALDGSFIPGNYFSVSALAVQSDNKVIIGGSGPYYVYRLNADGSMENAFTNYSTGPNGPIYAVAVQPDGKIIIGGSFTSFNGTTRNNIARLDADGWLDYSFLYGMTGVSGGPVRCVQVQPDGKILIGGDFTTVNGSTRSKITRLTSTGALDTGFAATTGLSGTSVYAVAIQSDSSLLIGGSFSVSVYNSPTYYYSYNVARLYADGTMDNRFLCPNYYLGTTYAVAAQDNGGVIAGGTFTYSSTNRYLARVYGNLYPPEFILQPTNRSATVGTNVTLTALVSNPTPTSYQWHKNGSDISGATGMAYTLYNVQMGDAGTYSVSAYNAAGNTSTSNAVLNVGITPGITVQPLSVIAPLGGTTNISVTATGTPLSYVWRKNGSVLPGATSSGLSFPNLVSGDAGTYYVIVSNFLKTVNSSQVTLTVTPALPVITTQPQSQTVAAGSPVTFSVIATNATSYSWRKDGLIVYSGPPTYTIPVVITNQAGNYTVVATGSGGSVTSSVAVLTVIALPYFTLQPKSANTNIGATVTFSATVAGATPIGLQWRKDGVNIPYATLSTYTLGNVQVGDSGVYSLYAYNAAGGVDSSNAVLNVGIRPAITAWTGSLTVTQGQSASFTVSASGTPLTYIWRKGSTVIATATGATYTIPSTVGSDAGVYSVTVSNALGTAVASGTLTVIVPISIAEQPSSRIVGEGSNTTFMVTAIGTSPAYQWCKGGTSIAGETNALFTINNVQFSDAADYTVVVTNILNAVTSQVATLTVQRFPPAITDQPLSQSAPVGSNTTFTVGATGTTLTYQWLKEGTNILDATTADLMLTNVGFADAGGYSVIITNPLGSVTSIVATLTVGYPPAIVNQPTNLAVPVGSNALFSVAASGTDPLNYQWLKGGATLLNQTNRTLHLNGVTALDAGGFAVLVSSPFGAVTSLVATLTIQFPPQITQQPIGGIRPAGSNITFSVTATGTEPLVYQWQKDGVDLTGATATNYAGTNLTVADSGAYTVLVTNFLGSVTSVVATLTVGNPPVVVAPPQSSTNLLCRTIVLSCTVTGTAPMNLQWLYNGTPLPGETNATLTLMNLQGTNAGSYTLSAANAFGGTVSASAQLSIYGTGGATAWQTTGALNTGRSYHTATELPNGKVLVAGGWDGTNYLASVELYEPATKVWTTTSAMNTPRMNYTATLLPNGKVLVSGGGNGSTVLSSSELYDPTTGLWTPTGEMLTTRYGHTAALLLNGKVLVVAGSFANPGSQNNLLASAELYDPATGMWTATGTMSAPRALHAQTRLSDGRVLVCGGVTPSGSWLSSAGIYNPATETWTDIAAMNDAHLSHTASLLSDGRVLIAGAGSSGVSAELFNPSSGIWTTIGAMNYPRQEHTATMLTSGQILVAGGGYSISELYDPSTSTWVTNSALNTVRRDHTATRLASGAVLVAGGIGDAGYPISSAELYANSQATVVVTLGNLSQTYDGTAKSVSVTTTAPGLPVDVSYDGSANPPTNAGSYIVVGTINDACYQGGVTNTLVIAPAAAGVTLDNLAQTYDGTAKPVKVSTTPPDLATDVTYSGFAFAPTNAGSYTVIATITDPNYQGSATNTLVISVNSSIVAGGATLTNGTFQVSFASHPGGSFSVLATTNLALPLSDWTVLGAVTEVAPGHYQFTDLEATNCPQRLYRVRSP